MEIKFYNVEHGSCTHIITPKNQHFLIDAGSKTSKSLVNHLKNKYLKGFGQRIDYLIITHPHEDHIYDLPAMYDLKMEPRVLRRPKAAYDIVPSQNTPLHRKIADTANSMNNSYTYELNEADKPWMPNNNGGIEFEFISPKSEWTTKEDLNSFSGIIIVKYLGYKFILTGDNPKSILQKCMDENHEGIIEKVKDASVLLAPHHGRENEYCDDFFKCVNPYLTVISDKSIEHKTQEYSSSLYVGRGANINGLNRYVYTTRKDGNITFNVSDNSCTVSNDMEEY